MAVSIVFALPIGTDGGPVPGDVVKLPVSPGVVCFGTVSWLWSVSRTTAVPAYTDTGVSGGAGV